MNKKRRLWIIIVTGIIITLIVGLLALRVTFNCCAPIGDYFTSTAIVATNQKLVTQISQTQTATAQAPMGTFSATPSS